MMPRAAATKAPIRALLFLLLSMVAFGQTRLNVGGPLYTDSNGYTWLADTGCTGTVYSQSSAVSGTSDDTLYQTGRTGNNFSCEFAVAVPAFYYVTVRLAEYVSTYTSTNPRIFNIFVNGSAARTINTSTNCASQLSGCDFTFGPYAIYDANLVVSFSTVSQPAFVDAIQVTLASITGEATVTSLTVADPTSTQVRIRAGSAQPGVSAGEKELAIITKLDGTVLGFITQSGQFISTAFGVAHGCTETSGVVDCGTNNDVLIDRFGQFMGSAQKICWASTTSYKVDGSSENDTCLYRNTLMGLDMRASTSQTSLPCMNILSWRTDLLEHRKVATINCTADGVGKGAFVVYDGDSSAKGKVAMFGHETDTAAGIVFASGARIYSRSSTDINTAPGDDTCLERSPQGAEVGFWRAEACITTLGMEDYTPNGGFTGRAFVHDPVAAAKPTCNSAHRGWTWATKGGAGVADTFEVCNKDAADAYSWRALF